MSRWDPDYLEPAPDVEEALAAVGLPVVRCERQTIPPHWVRTEYSRKLSPDEKELATRVKTALKAGKFDPAKERAWFDRKSQTNPAREPASASRQRVPDVEDAFRLAAISAADHAPQRKILIEVFAGDRIALGL